MGSNTSADMTSSGNAVSKRPVSPLEPSQPIIEDKGISAFSKTEVTEYDSWYNDIRMDFEHVGITVTKVEHLTNPVLKRKYDTERDLVRDLKGHNEHFDLNERYLYHGTPGKNLDRICREGLELRLGKTGCFGKGIYFSDNPEKCAKYAEKGSDDNYYILVVRVLLGESKVYTKGEKDLALWREPVKDHETGERYDSVEGWPRGHKEFVVYETRRTLPEVIITYTRPSLESKRIRPPFGREKIESDYGADSDEDSDFSASDNFIDSSGGAESDSEEEAENSYDDGSGDNVSVTFYPTLEEKKEADSRSVYVSNVDYAATEDELKRFFSHCGNIYRVTIIRDKITKHPKGNAYIEFERKGSVRKALSLDNAIFRQRSIKVSEKRTNLPGISKTDMQPRGRDAHNDKEGEFSNDDSSEDNISFTSLPKLAERKRADSRSVYVGNVDYGATEQELKRFFSDCGDVCRVTIIRDKVTKHPKGFAYIEFLDEGSMKNALCLDFSHFRGRLIKVSEKRTNLPGKSTRDRRPKGKGVARGPLRSDMPIVNGPSSSTLFFQERPSTLAAGRSDSLSSLSSRKSNPLARRKRR